MDDVKATDEFLSQQQYMVIAVVADNGNPWAVPVRIQTRNGWQFEWDSRRDTVHSSAIEKHSDIAITIFDKQPQYEFGFYAIGRAELVEEKGEYGRYRFIARQAWVNDHTFVKREITLI